MAERRTRAGVMYRQGLSISELQTRMQSDLRDGLLSEAQLYAAYGRDHKQGAGLLEDEPDHRITSYHLRSPFYVDQFDIEYTPRETPSTESLLARISPSKARSLRKRMQVGDSIDDQAEIGVWCFPPAGTVLQLRMHRRFYAALMRQHGRDRAKQMLLDVVATVTVVAVSGSKTASAEIDLARPLQVDAFLIRPQGEVSTEEALKKAGGRGRDAVNDDI
jgi:hypothetical protein